ncbi:MAG: DUF4825 domain-containing protein [Clostridia bacterium]|nr:DUF4825 domain-containing protein [Clostridia bacterium]
MEHELSCEIVRDLLPSYTEGLTSGVTNTAIEAHLGGCADCASALARMREPEIQQSAPAPEVDYLKKVRRHSTGRSLIIGIFLMVLGMSLLAFRFFYVGNALDASELIFHVSVEGDTVTVRGAVAGSSGLGVSRVTFADSAGIVQVKVYGTLATFFNSGDFSASYTAQSPIGQVRADDLILWENGVAISATAARLFAETNPFVGDMPANNRIAAVLGIADQFGPYTNALQTKAAPYGWTLLLETPIAADDEAAARGMMAADAYAMLASIENLGYVTWQYSTPSGAREYTVTAEDATAFAGKPIKDFARSASEMHTLLQSLSFKWSGVREAPREDDVFYLNIRNACSDTIYGVGVRYYLDGKLMGSGGFINADETPLSVDEEASFDFTPQDFPDGTSAMQLYGFRFDLYVTDEAGRETIVRRSVPISARYAWTYRYTLSGDYANGFSLREG